MLGSEYHAGETLHVGLDGVHLDGLVQAAVLMADAGAEQEDVHTAHLVDQCQQLRGGLFRCHVDGLDVYLGGGDRPQGFQSFLTSSGHTYLIAFLNVLLGYLIADARGSSYNDDSFHFFSYSCYFSLERKVTKSSRLTLLATTLFQLAEDFKLASLKQKIF